MKPAIIPFGCLTAFVCSVAYPQERPREKAEHELVGYKSYSEHSDASRRAADDPESKENKLARELKNGGKDIPLDREIALRRYETGSGALVPGGITPAADSLACKVRCRKRSPMPKQKEGQELGLVTKLYGPGTRAEILSGGETIGARQQRLLRDIGPDMLKLCQEKSPGADDVGDLDCTDRKTVHGYKDFSAGARCTASCYTTLTMSVSVTAEVMKHAKEKEAKDYPKEFQFDRKLRPAERTLEEYVCRSWEQHMRHRVYGAWPDFATSAGPSVTGETMRFSAASGVPLVECEPQPQGEGKR